MAAHSKLHPYLTWTKERIDEMDAALASLEASTRELKADARTKSERLLADLKKRRNEFKAAAAKLADAGEAAWEGAKAQLETQWNAFEAQVKSYFQTAGKQIEQQHAAFHDIAEAQRKSWRKAADELRHAAVSATAANRATVDAAIKQMQADAAEAEARLQKLMGAKNESWPALSAALAHSRKAFDRASRQAWDAFSRARS